MSAEPPEPGRLLRPSSLDAPPNSGPTPRRDPLIGQTIDGRYYVEKGIGEGGMGIVYAGRHTAIGKRVAIKVLRSEMVRDPELAGRFLQEARAASSIGNPHIVDISDFGRLPDGSTYFVMELLEGKSLGDLVTEARGPLPVPRVIRIAKQIAQGLAAAHTAKIVHRDLKPDNVMLVRRGDEEDFVKILDFGIAKVGAGGPKWTQVGSVFGTPHYMSPEQGSGAPVDHRTDIYALGVITYEMLTGWVPFDGADALRIVHQHIHERPKPLATRAPSVKVPPALEIIVQRCLAKDPAARYPTMEQLVAALTRLERGEAEAPPVSSSAPAPAPTRWALVAAMALVSVGTLVVVAMLLVHSRHPGATRVPVAAAAPRSSQPVPTLTTPSPSLAVSPPPEVAASVPMRPGAPAAVQREVLVSVTPADAVISREGVELGAPPIALHLADGEAAELTVARRGYRSKTVRVDGSEPKVAVALEVLASTPAVSTPRKPGHDDVSEFSKSF